MGKDREELRVTGDGPIPNSTYTIEYYDGYYKAIRGTGYYMEDRLNSREDALAVILKDAQSKGATNIQVS